MPHRRLRCLLLVAPVFSLSLNPAAAQVLGFDRDDVASPRGARGIVAADLNGDGWSDLATADTQPATVGVQLNRGTTGGFALARTIALSGGPFEIAAGDFDRDGRVDLAVANADANTIDVILTGAVTPTTWSQRSVSSYAAPGGPRGLAVADLDGDGRLDIAYTVFYANSVTVLFGNGDGSFSARGLPAIAVGTRPQGVAAADFNRDGRQDLAIANTTSRVLTVLYGTSTAGVFTRRDFTSPYQMNVVIAADLTGDGWPDAAAVSSGANAFAVFAGSASGLAMSSSGVTGASPRGIAAADLDVDGHLDLVVGNRGDSTAGILLQQSAGVFAMVDEVPSASGARAVATADFNRDGRADFATGNELAAVVSVFKNAPALDRAAYAFTRTDLGAPNVYTGRGVAVADLNHNGKPDIVAGDTVTLDGDATTRRTLPIPLPAEIKDAAVLDVNRDGHPDVAVLFRHYDLQFGSQFDGYYVFNGDGAGRFVWSSGAGVYGATGSERTFEMEAGDFNRDGWDDLVIATTASTTPSSTANLLLNTRNGDLAPRRQIPLAGTVYALAIGDVTADGKLDVVMSLQSPTGITVEVGDGNGGFVNEAETSIDVVPSDIELADFDRDGFVDFIVADGPNVHALKGDGKGHYVAKQTFKPTYRPGDENLVGWVDRVLVADVTDDGLPDIVTNVGLVLPGNTQGSFGPPEEFEWYWLDAAAGDLDSDGDLDLVVSDYYGLTVLRNERTRPNQAPIANAGPDGTWSYAYQFDAEEFYLDGGASTDADMHRLTYEWRENGKLLGYGRNLWPGRLTPGTHTYELTVRDDRGGESKDTVIWTIDHFEEIVIISNWAEKHGNWQVVEDATAAEGLRFWNPNAGVPKLSAPLASPADYIDIWFTPDPTLEYKLWIRGKADGNNWANDSIFVQFSDAVDSAGQAVYRMDTPSGLAVNLEECSGCGISGWGWEDDGWGAVDKPGVLLRFPNPDWQRIRIQRREDGFSFDQIVLSAAKYKTQRPGKAKNDATILQRTQY